MTAISRLEKLGYVAGIAHGSVAAEIDARTNAVLETAPEKLLQQAGEMALQTVLEGQAIGARPPDGMTWADLSSKLAEQAYRMLEEGSEARIDMHDRALAIAEESPTVWYVEGWGSGVYISIDDSTGEGHGKGDRALIENLLDADAHAERMFQSLAPPSVVSAVVTMRARGVDVEKATADEDGFKVKVAGAAVATDEGAVAKLAARFVPDRESP